MGKVLIVSRKVIAFSLSFSFYKHTVYFDFATLYYTVLITTI